MQRPFLLMKRGRFWYFKLPDQTSYHSTGITSRASAEAFTMRQTAAPPVAAPRLSDFAAEFFAWNEDWARRQRAKGRRCGRANTASRQRHLDGYILPAFGSRRIDELTRPAIERWLLTLKLSNQTRNHILYTFRIVLREAVDEGLISISPLAHVEPLGRDARARDVFSATELRALFPEGNLAAVWGSQRVGVLFLVLASTGIRSGEARALRWEKVNLEDRVALIDATCIGGTTEIGPISTQKGGAKLAILPQRTVEELATWRKNLIWKKPGDLVFPGRGRGIPISAATVSHALPGAISRLASAATEQGLPAPVDPTGRNLVVHSFRHTWISAARRLLPDELLRRLTGHHSTEVTDLYDHPRLEQMLPTIEPARKVVEELFG